jgi:hypothetical protein
MFFFGLDLGKRRDPSTIAAIEVPDTHTTFHLAGPPPREVVLRFLETMELKTPYTEVVRRASAVLNHTAVPGNKRLAVDATGVGEPVVEMLVKARLPCELMPIVITGGYNEYKSGRIWYVPKLDLLAGLQALFESEELKLAKNLPELPQLIKELLSVKYEFGVSRKIHIGAEGHREHDDRVMALALACWAARRYRHPEPGGRLFW